MLFESQAFWLSAFDRFQHSWAVLKSYELG